MYIMESERLKLRRFSSDDWQDLHEYLSQEEVIKYEPYNVLSAGECKELAISRSKNDDFWAVCLKENNKLIGNIYFHQQEPIEFMTWTLGYVFNPLYYGNGYATEACLSVLHYGFEEMGAHRVTAKCNTENVASWKLLERLSMRREGHFLKPASFKKTSDGKPIWHDAYQYSILEEEWFASTRRN